MSTFDRMMAAIIRHHPQPGPITVLLNTPDRGVAAGPGIVLNGRIWPRRSAAAG